MRNIFLTGFMGAGKTSVGRLLAVRLSYRFVDLDAKIVAEAKKSITEIFEKDGEAQFRKLESTVLARIAGETGAVVATGGGVVIAESNRRLMRESGVVVNLTATHESVLMRLSGDVTRPLLNGDNPAERVAALMAEREAFYADADLTIATDGKSLEDIVAELIARLTGKNDR